MDVEIATDAPLTTPARGRWRCARCRASFGGAGEWGFGIGGGSVLYAGILVCASFRFVKRITIRRLHAVAIHSSGHCSIRRRHRDALRLGRLRSWAGVVYSPAKPVIYVNGMQNSGRIIDNAQALSLMVGAPVYGGVFNKSAGMLKDVYQCVTDKGDVV